MLIGQLTVTMTFLRAGPATPEFAGDLVVTTLVEKACMFLTFEAIKQRPYFLYLALTSPHTPVLPAPAWKGKSEVGPYGDPPYRGSQSRTAPNLAKNGISMYVIQRHVPP